MGLNGLNIIPSVLAVTRRWEVQRHPIAKRRRNWRPVMVERPGCYQAGNVLFMHPDIVAILKARTS